MEFTTYDEDNDERASVNCATAYKTAWWMKDCFRFSPNGPYKLSAPTVAGFGLIWRFDVSDTESLKFTEMRLCR